MLLISVFLFQVMIIVMDENPITTAQSTQDESHDHFLGVFTEEHHSEPDPFKKMVKLHIRLIYACLFVLVVLQGSAYLVFTPRHPVVAIDPNGPSWIYPTSATARSTSFKLATTTPRKLPPTTTTATTTTSPTTTATTATAPTSADMFRFNLFCPTTGPEIVRAMAGGTEPRYIAVCPTIETLAFLGGNKVLAEMTFADFKSWFNGDITGLHFNSTLAQNRNETLVFVNVNYAFSLTGGDFEVLRNVYALIG